MSPERATGEMPKSDRILTASGATFYELLTGRPPFRGTTMQDLLNKQVAAKPDSPQLYNPDVSDDMAASFILKMLAKKSRKTAQNCHEVLMALRKIKIYKSQPIPAEEKESMMR